MRVVRDNGFLPPSTRVKLPELGSGDKPGISGFFRRPPSVARTKRQHPPPFFLTLIDDASGKGGEVIITEVIACCHGPKRIVDHAVAPGKERLVISQIVE